MKISKAGINFIYYISVGVILLSIAIIFLSNFTYDIQYKNSLDNIFGDMWSHFLDGNLEATREIIGLEGFYIGDKVYAYVLPLPAFIRGALSVVGLQDYSIPSFLVASCVYGISTFGLLRNIAYLASSKPGNVWIHYWFPFFLLPILTLYVSTKFYWEASIWGLAIFQISIFSMSAYLINNSTFKKLCLIICISLLLFTRPTYSIAATIIFLAMILDEFRKFIKDGKNSFQLQFTRFAPYLLFVVFLCVLGWLNYKKWGNVFTFAPFQFNGHVMANNLREKMFGSEATFSISRIPETIEYYFGVSPANFSIHQPFLKGGEPVLPSIAYFDYREMYYSFTIGLPIYLFFSALGIKSLVTNRAHVGVRKIMSLLVISAIPFLLLLPILVMASRYRAELFSFLTISGAVGIHFISQRISKIKSMVFAFIFTMVSALLIFNNILVERNSFFGCEKGVIPLPLLNFYHCPPDNLFELSISNPLNFTKQGSGRYYLSSGWSSPEEWGVWSDGDRSKISIPISYVSEPSQMILLIKPFLGGRLASRNITILVNGVKQSSVDLSSNEAKPIILNLKNITTPLIDIEFLYANSASPKDLGLGEDTRKLAIGLMSIELNAD